TFWPSSTTTARNVAVGMIGMPPFATASRSRSVARSAWMIQSTPASAAARVGPAPRGGIPTRRGGRGARPPGVNPAARVAAVRLTDNGGDLVLRQHLRFAAATVRHLDEIDA